MSESKARTKCSCGKQMERDFAAEHEGFSHRPGNWPLKSDALGVHPSQIAEAKEQASRNGIDVDFTSDGRAILKSARHRKEYAESMGFFDMDGSYSSPQPGARRRD